LKSGLVTAAVVLCLVGAMPGLVFAVNGVLRSPAVIGAFVLLVLGVCTAVAYMAQPSSSRR
jgi:hypothetical protein